MNSKDFIEIIDLSAEYKEYIRFTSAKSKKHQSYAAWDAYIEDLLLDSKSSVILYNLKRHCAHRIRSKDDSSNIVWGYIGLAFPLVLMFSTEKDRIGLTGIAMLTISMAFLIYVIIFSKAQARKKHFYEDILRIIEQIENQV